MHGRTDGRTPARLPSYKLTFETGSGELICLLVSRKGAKNEAFPIEILGLKFSFLFISKITISAKFSKHHVLSWWFMPQSQ